MHIRSLLVAVFSGALVVGLVSPALAHEEISPRTFPIGRPAFLTLTAANESSTDLVKLSLKAPAGLPLGAATRSPAGWTAAVNGATVTWTGGALKPGTFDTWGFETEGADQPGAFTYSVTSTFANGRTDTHDVEVTAAAGAGGATPAPTPATAETTAPAAAPSTVAAPAGSGDEVDETEDSDGASGTAKAALALSIVALLVAGGAVALSVRRRGPAADGAAPAGGGTGPGAAQDW